MDSDSSSLVYLNVGGKKFCTYNDTLTRPEPNSMLATMFSGRHSLIQDHEGYTFIDRDGEYFGYILNWLRDSDVPSLKDSKYSQLRTEGGRIL
ncbi:putative chromatin remodeling & transcription regulator BTB-POZ family [Rosa chinensis]|uniref:Putative chromatin remodeling & transcription regulator BTB-POZ family n=1 Tax=Rosa chinensis TaxID=74649 RepID=A0A2P6QL75_ROSCH|nr:putative chromatin remodeling & transcription regulator BTB-POZ family [Rosa chinensis]